MWLLVQLKTKQDNQQYQYAGCLRMTNDHNEDVPELLGNPKPQPNPNSSVSQ